jgi:SAM-dependent methyltransferase
MPHSHADTYLDPYRQAHDLHGPDFAVTLWASPRSQETRFRVLAEMCYLHGKRILDAGCSRGDLAAYLLKRDIAYEHYLGIDGLKQVIDFARQRGLQHAEFLCGDFVTQPHLLTTGQPQVIAISGTLNTMDDLTALRVLKDAWDAAGQTLIFNFLSDRAFKAAPAQNGPARRLDTMALLDWATRQTPSVQFRQDYFRHGHDATIAMNKH